MAYGFCGQNLIWDVELVSCNSSNEDLLESLKTTKEISSTLTILQVILKSNTVTSNNVEDVVGILQISTSDANKVGLLK